jgi:hypothetical protein
MSNDQDNDSKPQENEPASNEKPNPNIKPPEYMVITEGFDPPRVGKIIKKVLEAD